MFKATLLINSASGLPCGWSESFYIDFVTASIVEPKVKELIQARLGTLCEQFEIVAARMTEYIPGSPARSKLITPGSPQVGVLPGPADYPNTAALYRMTGIVGSHSRDMRGFPDSRYAAPSPTGRIELTPTGKAELKNWTDYIIAKAWGWLRYPGPGDPAPESFVVNNLTADAGTGYIKLNGPVPAGWLVTPRPLLMSGFQGQLGGILNGLWSTKNAIPNTGYVLVKTTAPTGVLLAYPPGSAKVSRPDFIFQRFSTGSYVRVSSRKTGRPFGLLVGRRSNSR